VNDATQFIVLLSGGITSWAAAKRVAEIHGTANMTLLFADTGMEDEDCYRFVHEGACNIGAPLVILKEGRTPWELFRDQKMIGTSKADICSRMLKRDPLDKWRNENCDPETTKMVVGILWDESHRIDRLQDLCKPWQYIAPLCDKPWISKSQCLEWAAREGLHLPRLYSMGFAHNNCGGFCIKAGRAAFANLLRRMPERYAWHEQQEQETRAWQAANGVQMGHVLYKDRNGKRERITLEQFREEIEGRGDEFDGANEWGGCGCALPL
jgi:3'-phosphoadenosine 5'-phosphosulfate sulfotransferase (PAPS reductase)/FAD synthetase